MLSMFLRKPKVKTRHNTSYAEGIEVTNENANVRQSNSSQLSKDENPKKTISASDLPNRSKLRANSASPQPVSCARRTPGTSVTFESTLPTQVWQASPSPSPPLPLGSNTKQMNQRMVSSLSDNWVEKPVTRTRPKTDRRLRGRSYSNSFHSWIADMDADDSSDETNHSDHSNTSVSSSCSSSDESLTGTDRQGEGKTSSGTNTVTTDSTSSLDMRMVSNSDGNLVQSVASSMTRRHSAGQQNQQRKKDRLTTRKSKSEKKRRNFPTHVISSSSSSSDEDLEALGWDERTISALANRNKARQTAALRQSITTQNLSNRFNKQSKEYPMVNNSAGKAASSWSNQNVNLCIPLQPLTPIQVDYERTYTSTVLNHPQSCVLSRRAHQIAGGQQMACLSSPNQNQTKGMENTFMNTLPTAAGHGSDLLAVITADYKPLAEWEEQYKVIPVRKGDYVCVLSRPMKSRTCNGASSAKRTGRHCAENGKTNDDANTWLYVRRWCVDHLVATGPPGFVPRNHCRLLPSSELLRLWHHNQTMKAKRMQTSIPSTTSTSANPCADITISCTRPIVEHNSFHNNCMRTYNNQADCSSPSTNSSASVQNQFPYVSHRSDTQRCAFAHPMGALYPNHSQIPPPPPGFGSGGSIGSETEDRDSGRGPSSGSEWGSGRGGSSSVTLDQSTVEKTASDTGIERRTLPNTERTRNVKSAEESQLGWYTADCSVWSSEPGSSHRDDGIYSHDSALQSPNENSDRTPQLLNRTMSNCATERNDEQTSPQPIHSSPLTLTTKGSCTPVLEMRPGGTPILYARGMPMNVLLGTDSLATSTTTCATVIETKLGSESESLTTEKRTENPDPTYWEPYQTVIHVNENSLEKFTLV